MIDRPADKIKLFRAAKDTSAMLICLENEPLKNHVMRIPRVYVPADQGWQPNAEVTLPADSAHHVGRVLRMQEGQALELFTGDGMNYAAVIKQATKRDVIVEIISHDKNASEAPIHIHLGQGISRGDRMDFVLQKSVELGVTEITPLFTERCGVKLVGDRLEKKRLQWQKIVISACEQSGRSVVPKVNTPVAMAAWFEHLDVGLRLTLDPYAQTPLCEMNESTNKVALLIGPEGGLTDAEVTHASQQSFQPVRLGPRILRTETAALAAITVIQYQFGDLA